MKHYQLSVIAMALAAAGFSGMSYAQQTTKPTGNAAEEGVEVIQVTGIRRSLMQSQAVKMESTSVVEAVSAEEIGKLPDMSIAESIARLPGLAAQRLDGRANVVSVRGLAPDFTTATLNGREQVTVGDNRGVEFDQYPSEMMNNVVVYKTPDAGVMAQAIGGTIDMQTVRPLAHGEQTMVFNLRGERNDLGALNPDSTANGYRGSFSYIDQFADDTLGVALGYARMTSPSQEERWNTWEYQPVGSGANAPLLFAGAKPYVRSSELTRDGWLGIVEYKPNDQLHSVVDLYYSDFSEEQQLRGIELPINPAWFSTSLLPGYTVENGLVTKGTIANVEAVIRNDVNLRDATTQAIGWNNRLTLSPQWALESDISYSKAERQDFGLEGYMSNGRGTGVGAKDSLDFTLGGDGVVRVNNKLNYADPSIQIGAPLSWGNGVSVKSDGQDGFINMPSIEDELSALRLSAERSFDAGAISAVEFGANYSQREKSKINNGYYLTLKQYPALADVPANLRLAPTSLDFFGMGAMASFDSMAFYRAGNYTETSEALTDEGRLRGTWSVEEDVLTLYGKANVETELRGVPVRGNFGLQIVDTDQSSNGFLGNKNDTGYVQVTPSSGGDSYTEWLPSANFSFEVADQRMIRVAAARTLARARMDQMNASAGGSYDAAKANSTDINSSPWKYEGGNPNLKPWMAKQYDVSYEHYFNDDGYYSAAVFYKDLENYVFNEFVEYDFTNVPVAGPQPNLRKGFYTRPSNGNGGHIQGLELSLSLTGQMLDPALTGLGMVIGGSYTDSEVKQRSDSPAMSLPGLSRKVVNATLYYEREGFEVRTSARYRSDFLGEVTGRSLSRNSVNVKGETVIDAQVAYDFSQSNIEQLYGLSVLFQISNLNNEPFVTYNNGDQRQVRDYQNYGRSFMFGVSYKL